VFKILLQNGAQMDFLNNNNKTPLQLAEERHYDDLVELFS
jgi:hypothetical protein